MRRRLGHGKRPTERYGWKPFGNVDYGYDEQYMTVVSFTIWALVTWGSLSVDPWEASALLAGLIAWSESSTTETMGAGASYIHNVQAGYCWYHYFVKGQRQWPLFLGSWAEMAGDMGAIAQELMDDEELYSHLAHYRGAALGLTLAFLTDMMRPKKGKSRSLLWKSAPFLAIAIMYFRTREDDTWAT
jgi:hypothetical protein